MSLGPTISQPTRFPGGLTNVTKGNPMGVMESLSPIHEVLMGWGTYGQPLFATGNTPASNSYYTVTSTTTTGTASLADNTTYPPAHLLTTGTTANDEVVLQEVRTVKKNLLSYPGIRKVLVVGNFKVTSTIANSRLTIGLFTGTSNASLGNDSLCFNTNGATLNFVNRNNGGTAVTTAISTGLVINTLYSVAALLDPIKSTVSVYFGITDSLDLRLSTQTPQEVVATNTISVATANIPDGTNAVKFGFGALAKTGAAATVQFGPCFCVIQ
jgi:hypothetical protein